MAHKTFLILCDSWNKDNEIMFNSPNEQERDAKWEELKAQKRAKFSVDRFGQETITFDSPYGGYLNHIYGHRVYKKSFRI